MRGSTLLAGLLALLIVGGACFGAGYFVAKEQIEGGHSSTPVVAKGDDLDQPALDDSAPLQAPMLNNDAGTEKSDNNEHTPEVAPKADIEPEVKDDTGTESESGPASTEGVSAESNPGKPAESKEETEAKKVGKALDEAMKKLGKIKEMKPEDVEELFNGKKIDFSASIAGQVFDQGGVPVANAKVYASYSEDYSSDEGGRTLRFVTTSGGGNKGQAIATTDGGGYFNADIKRKVSEKARLRVALTAGADGYADSEKNKVTLKNGDKKEGIKLILRGAGAVTGRVVDANGAGIEGVTVGLNPAGGNSWGGDTMVLNFGGSSKYSAKTDVGGNFTIEGIPEGRYKFKLSGSGYRQVAGPTEIDVKSGQTTNASADFQVAITASVSVKLLDAEGNPLRGWATLKFSDDSGKVIKRMQGSIKKSGVFEQNDPPAGSYNVEIKVWGYKPQTVRANLLEGQRYDFGSLNFEKDEKAGSDGIYFPGSGD
jgi:protocatechuate 3,4-dioxygenase beta subunit